MRSAIVLLLSLVLVQACAGFRQTSQERGSHEPPAGSCVDNAEGRAYMETVWRALQDAWRLPRGVPAGHSVEMTVDFDAEGNPGRPVVGEATNEALRESVEKAAVEVDLPETPEELRACFAGRRLAATFRNPDLSR
jgi:hypothetical protein